jgi:hypothetical protein
MRTTLALAFFLFLLTGCGADRYDSLEVRRELVGDTAVLTAVGAPDTVDLDPEVLWRSDELEQPLTMALVPTSDGVRLLAGDRTRVHILALAADGVVAAETVGREGGGPGEYRGISSVGSIAPDTLAVWDVGAMRLTLLGPDGRLLGVRELPATGDYRPQFRSSPLRAADGYLLDVSQAPLNVGERTPVALVRRPVTGDTAAVLEEWPGAKIQLIESGGQMLVGSHRLFSDAMQAVVGPGRRVARGNGLDYCVTVFRVGDPAPPRRLCRNRERTPVGDGIRHPDWSRIEDPGQRSVIQALAEAMEVGDRLPSYDRLLWSEDGKLWVRTKGPEVADVHPYFEAMQAKDGAAYRLWDVFDPEVGTVQTVRVPAAFDPEVVAGSTVYGFYELPTGEIAVGRATIPEPGPTPAG